jgi:glycosyltransferase involved in cell wall biosynthesis
MLVRKFDLVHMHFLRADLISLVVALHPRSIISVWGSDVRTAAEGAYVRWDCFPRFALRHASAVTATNPFLARRAIDKAKKVITVEVIPFGVDTSEFKPSRGAGNRGETVTFCFAKGKLIETYAPDILLVAFAKTIEQIKNVRILMTGEAVDEFGQELTGLVKRLGIEDKVEFLGLLTHAQMITLFQSADVYIQSSRWESFGVSALEALACGTAVIATDVGGVSDFLTDGIDSLIVPAGDSEALSTAMIKLALDKELRNKISSTGLMMVQEKFNWEVNISQMEQVYDRLVTE